MKKFILLLIVASASVLRLTSIPTINRSKINQNMIQASNRCHYNYGQKIEEAKDEWFGKGSKKGPYYLLQTDPKRKKKEQNFDNKRQAAEKNFEVCRNKVVKMYGKFMWVTKPTGDVGQLDNHVSLGQYFQSIGRGIGM